MSAQILTADTNGIHLKATAAGRSSIAWDEIFCISGYMLDCKTRLLAVVTLDWDNGEFFELMDDWSGFENVVGEITLRVSCINPNWIDRIRSLAPGQSAIQVWKRRELKGDGSQII